LRQKFVILPEGNFLYYLISKLNINPWEKSLYYAKIGSGYGGKEMKKRITIEKAYITEEKLMLETNETITELVPGEQILVDSDHYSFIYLMEDMDDYTYIILHEQIWPLLKTAEEKKLPVWITFNEEQKELNNFHDEFNYVLTNIKGNSNYGKEMVTKVESIFLT